VRCIPRFRRRQVVQSDPIVVADDRRTLAAERPVVACGIGRAAVGRGTGRHIVLVGRVAPPLTTSPRALSAVCLFRLLLPCKSSTLPATTTPLAFFHGPLPMRSRAWTKVPPLAVLVLS
jgi:hypothetical protein